jgi:hypothetical protein
MDISSLIRELMIEEGCLDTRLFLGTIRFKDLLKESL